MALTIVYPPGFVDVPDSTLVAGQTVNGYILTAIKENAAFGGVKWEVFYGEYQHGDQVPLPISSVDGYQYQQQELIYVWEFRSTVNLRNGLPSAHGGILALIYGVVESGPLAGQVFSEVAYYVDGGAQTNTHDGVLSVYTFGIRGRVTRAISAAPSYTDLAAGVFAQDQPLTQSNLQGLSHNAKLSSVRSEVFIMNGSGAPVWQANTAYNVGDLVQPSGKYANGAWYVCALAGTSGAVEPGPWPSQVLGTVIVLDGGALWNIAGWGFMNGQQIPLPVSPIDGYSYSAAECIGIIPFLNTTTGIPHSSGVDILWTSGKGNITRLRKSTTTIQPNPPADPTTPPAPTLSFVAGGSLAATTYYAQVTWINYQGESAASAEASLAVPANNTLVVNSPPAGHGAYKWHVYAGNTAGGGSGSETRQDTGAGIVIGANWAEPASGLISTGAAPPGVSVPSSGGVPRRGPAPDRLTARAATTAYAFGAVVLDSNYNAQYCTVAGTSGAGAPSWSAAVGSNTTDGGVTWLNIGHPSGWMSVLPTPAATPNNQKDFPAQLSPGASATGAAILNLAVDYENGSFPDGVAGVVIITQRNLGATMAAPGGANFVDFSDQKLSSGQPAEVTWMQDINENAKFSILRPEIFFGTYAGGQTVSLPVSPVDGYIYARSELTYQWIALDTGLSGGRIRDYQTFVDPQTGLASTRIDYFLGAGSDPYTSIGTVLRGATLVVSGLLNSNDGIVKLLVITTARRQHFTELIASVVTTSSVWSQPGPPSTKNLIPNGNFEIWSQPNTTAVAYSAVADDWGITVTNGKTATLQETGLVGNFAQGLGANIATNFTNQRIGKITAAGEIGIGSIARPVWAGGIYQIKFIAKSSPDNISAGFFARAHLLDITQSQDVYFDLLGAITGAENASNGAALSNSTITAYNFGVVIPLSGAQTAQTTAGNSIICAAGGAATTLNFTPAYLWLEFLNFAPVSGAQIGAVEFVILDEVYLIELSEAVTDPTRPFILQSTFMNNAIDTSNAVAAGSLAQSGSTTLINVTAYTFQFGSGTLNYNSGGVDPGAYGTYYVYADDLTYKGGAVTFQAATSWQTVIAGEGRIYFGKITTTSGGGGSGGGGGSRPPQ